MSADGSTGLARASVTELGRLLAGKEVSAVELATLGDFSGYARVPAHVLSNGMVAAALARAFGRSLRSRTYAAIWALVAEGGAKE